ncbi:TetR/AcrR family transcriptional regulator [Nocardiopsis sp. CT-R113]|uniref:TetR/AcrR family transcriptional regulator n=1 Tax=Nocardiopsis codii TaxID=3065942 RepID=A0ABU7KAJ8_9ACTN|nr:TetR/AcrR family transcriptional regulator [Nocardiopsis sp. CT-R113]MEE2039256.1 TetR/AcrR family transcriptional regulator [Nocardiopsis sp. CT-R113]
MSTTSTGSRGPYARSAERRRSIARAVLDTVREKGHDRVTTAETARRAGTSEATALYHFPTKEHLLVAALELSDEESALRPFTTDPGMGLDELRAFVDTTTERAHIMRLHTALLGRATSPDHPAQEFLARHNRDAVAHVARVVRHRQRVGTAHPGFDAVEVARQFLATWDGLQAQWLLDPSFDFGDHLVQAFRRLTGQNWMEGRAVLLDPAIGV